VDVHIREQHLPGIGARYEISIEGHHTLILVAHRDGRRDIASADAERDEPVVVLSLSRDQAVTLGALLMGARFSFDVHEEGGDAPEQAVVETVTLGPASPVVGKVIQDVSLPADGDATLLAVIRDDTPRLVEDEETETVRAGDRLVIAARRERLDQVVRQLTG
jgi:TrkA domain protein